MHQSDTKSLQTSLMCELDFFKMEPLHKMLTFKWSSELLTEMDAVLVI